MTEFNNDVVSKSNQELLSMVYEFNIWSPEMLQAVENELQKRNILPADIADKKYDQINTEDIELTTGKQASLTGQVIGWLTVFGFLGVAIGFNYAFAKTKSKYSDKTYYKYNVDSRRKGTYLFFTSLLLTSLALICKFIVRAGVSI